MLKFRSDSPRPQAHCKRKFELFAHSEASTCFTRALEQLTQLSDPDTNDQACSEFDLQMNLSISLRIARGFSVNSQISVTIASLISGAKIIYSLVKA